MSLKRTLAWLAIFVLFLAYAASVPLVLWGDTFLPEAGKQGDFMILAIGFGVALFVVAGHVRRALKQYVQALHDLSPDDAEGLAARLLYGATSGEVLRVEAGQIDLAGPPVVHKVGGPALLSVDHTSVVVTSRLGVLSRILGPGFHGLQPFER
ncbi:MAG: hypothetical protein JXC32_15765, partial [Anaerolineae bacterium]|nr:hypothetical protein [Anaerolineae bacterium]